MFIYCYKAKAKQYTAAIISLTKECIPEMFLVHLKLSSRILTCCIISQLPAAKHIHDNVVTVLITHSTPVSSNNKTDRHYIT